MKEMVTGGNSKRLTIILVAVIIILALVLVYAFVISPSMNGYAVKLQNQGVTYALSAILTQLQQQGYVQIPVGNQTLILVPYQAPAGSSPTPAATTAAK